MKKNYALELMQRIVNPAMNNFVENGIIETLLPSFATKKTEFECFLLNSIMTMVATERKYPNQFKKENVFTEFTFACLEYYEKEKLYMPEQDFFDEDGVTKKLFEKWGDYENALGKLAETNDNAEIANMVFKPQFGMQSVVNEMPINIKKLRLSMMQTMVLIGEELSSISSKY